MNRPLTPMHVFVKEVWKKDWLDKKVFYELVMANIERNGGLQGLKADLVGKKLLDDKQIRYLDQQVSAYFGEGNFFIVLMVDDDEEILNLTKLMLSRHSYEIVTANNGLEALEIIERGTIPHLIILDVMMPGMNGWTFLKKLRTRLDYSFIPVIFLTALGAIEHKVKGFQLGADDYLTKPFDSRELHFRIVNVLKRYNQISNKFIMELYAPEKTFAMQGLFSEISICALLHLLAMEKKSGIIELTNFQEHQTGKIFLRKGIVIGAILDGQEEPIDEEAVYHMASWNKGSFNFQAQELEMQPRMDTETEYLLLEFARRYDEACK